MACCKAWFAQAFLKMKTLCREPLAHPPLLGSVLELEGDALRYSVPDQGLAQSRHWLCLVYSRAELHQGGLPDALHQAGRQEQGLGYYIK